MKYVLFFIITFLQFIIGNGQTFDVSGTVYDSETGLSLPFVNVVVNDTHIGTATDIDGKFKITSSEQIKFLHLTCVGYEPVDFPVKGKSEKVKIKMTPKEYELSEVTVVPGKNPAHRIILNCIDNIEINDPEKLPAFTYTTYDKMYFTLDLDSLEKVRLDSITTDTLQSDTLRNDLREYLKDHHIFLMETVTKRRFMYPDRNNENVIATRVSGLKDPIFVFVASMMQSTSFYKSRIKLLDKEYVNPISRGSITKYYFQQEDTIYNERGDSIFVISFRPYLNKNFDGLKGVISINSNRWAIQNVVAEPAETKGTMSLRIRQMYDFVNNEQWFPVQLNTEVILNDFEVGDSTISITTGNSGKELSQEKTVRMPFGFGKTYIRNIDLHPALRRRDMSGFAVDVDPNSSHRNDNFWLGYRVDSLTQKDINTYKFVDSISKEANLEKIVKTYESLISGKIPVWYLDLDIDRFFGYNTYEGFSLGAGLHTNDRLSQIFKIGGYFRYGFHDRAFKYGGDLDLMLYYNYDLKMKLFYMNDLEETSGVPFFDDTRAQLKPENFRTLLINRMDKAEVYKSSIQFRTLKYLTVNVAFSRTGKSVTNDYVFTKPQDSDKTRNFIFTKTTIGLKYAYGERIIRNMRKKVSLGTKYPVFWFQYTHGFKGPLGGEFEYNRYDFKMTKSFHTNYFGTTSVKIAAGYIDTDIPYTNLYNGNGSYRAFNIYAPFSFSTMRMNEFLSNKYIALYLSHDFGKLLVHPHKWFHPEFAIATNMGFGRLDFGESHKNIDYKTMEKGYYESGILVNNIINLNFYSLGAGAFYRYGPYSFPDAIDNLSAKFTITFKF